MTYHNPLARLLLFTATLIAAAGCQSQDLSSQSAVITNPSPEMIIELERTISTSLYGVPVTLATDAFSSGSIVTVENRRNSPDARLAGGTILSRPEAFRLIAQGNNCLLEKMSTGERFDLTVTRCQPADPTREP